ncbi:uncharacterized protein LOC113793389 isoform X2 [Dermatophagoides pteronyssinus]|uniref:uncharacterized protein LOC113793389 isoform X2 n=1 Tax=Dermatophagoides pteronyssinus TaxID=6956 RepID=UPI003F671BF0
MMIPTSTLPLLLFFATGGNNRGHIIAIGQIHSVNTVDNNLHKYVHQNMDVDAINQRSASHTLIHSFMPDIVTDINNDEYSSSEEFLNEGWFNLDYNNSDVLLANGLDPEFRLPHMHNITFLLNVSRDIPEKLRIILFGYILPNLFALTIITNLLIVAVLSQQHMRTPTNLVLLGMAVADLLTLLIPSPWYIYLFTMGHHQESIYPVSTCYTFHWMYEVLPPLFHTYSIWLTLLLAGQRYIYVCHFSLARRWCTVPQVVRFMLILLVIAILHQSTRFFDRKFLPVKYIWEGKIFEGCEYQTSGWVIKYFGEDLYYIFYYGFRIIFVHTGPCILLVWLNVLLFRALHRTRKTRKRLLSNSRGTTTMAAGPTSIVTTMMMTQTNNSTRRSFGSMHTNIQNNNNGHHINTFDHQTTNQNINYHPNCQYQSQSVLIHVNDVENNENSDHSTPVAHPQIIDCDINDDDSNLVSTSKHQISADHNQHQSQIKDDQNTIFSNSPTIFHRYGESIQRENSSIKLTHQMPDTNKIRINRLDSRSTTSILAPSWKSLHWLSLRFYDFRYFCRNNHKNSATTTTNDDNREQFGTSDKSFVSAADLAENRIDRSEIMAAYGNTSSDINNILNLYSTTNEIELLQQKSSRHEISNNGHDDNNSVETDSNLKTFSVTTISANTAVPNQLLPSTDLAPNFSNEVINDRLLILTANNQHKSTELIKSTNRLEQNESIIVNDDGSNDSHKQNHENIINDCEINNNNHQQTSIAHQWDQHSEKSYHHQIDSTMKIETLFSTTMTSLSKNKCLLETNL